MSEYIVIGLGTFGSSLAIELQALGNDVLCIDKSRDIVQSFAGAINQVIEADSTSEETLRELDVTSFDAAIVAIGELEPSIMTTLLLQKMGVGQVLARARTDLHAEILRLVGADRVLFPEQETALRLAHGIAVPQIVDYLSISSDMGISKLAVPPHLVGKTQTEANLGSRSQIRIVAIIRRDRVLFGAAVTERFEANDILLVAGRDDDLRDLSRQRREE